MRIRSCDAGICRASRYFATVRLATGTPSAFNVSASRASDKGLRGFSPAELLENPDVRRVYLGDSFRL